VTGADFGAHFDHFTRTVVRLEALPAYDVGGAEAERIRAWRKGLPRPERSVRTDPWLARIAVTTATAGKQWKRVRVVDEPLTWYQEQQLQSYRESQAAGERVLLARRSDVGDPGPDAWLFDVGTAGAFALIMRYDIDGRWLGYEHVVAPDEVAQIAERIRHVEEHAAELNVFLASVTSG
jgi:hypothetical protein